MEGEQSLEPRRTNSPTELSEGIVGVAYAPHCVSAPRNYAERTQKVAEKFVFDSFLLRFIGVAGVALLFQRWNAVVLFVLAICR